MENELTREILSAAMARSGMGGEAVYLPACASTNTLARELAKGGAPELSVALASHQSAGKGRAGRQWLSPDGTGLYVSILLRPNLPADKMPLLALVAAVAARGAIEAAGCAPRIKWPNDIVLEEKKVCGILMEAGPGWAVAGVGVNVSQVEEDFPPELRDRAASLGMLGVRASRAQLLSLLLAGFAQSYAQLAREGFGGILEQYRQKCATLSKEVRVIGTREEYRAHALDIDQDGALIVEREGRIGRVYGGDVSVRGIMGYV